MRPTGKERRPRFDLPRSPAALVVDATHFRPPSTRRCSYAVAVAGDTPASRASSPAGLARPSASATRIAGRVASPNSRHGGEVDLAGVFGRDASLTQGQFGRHRNVAAIPWADGHTGITTADRNHPGRGVCLRRMGTAAPARDIDDLLDLYLPDATLETPLIPRIIGHRERHLDRTRTDPAVLPTRHRQPAQRTCALVPYWPLVVRRLHPLLGIPSRHARRRSGRPR